MPGGLSSIDDCIELGLRPFKGMTYSKAYTGIVDAASAPLVTQALLARF